MILQRCVALLWSFLDLVLWLPRASAKSFSQEDFCLDKMAFLWLQIRSAKELWSYMWTRSLQTKIYFFAVLWCFNKRRARETSLYQEALEMLVSSASDWSVGGRSNEMHSSAAWSSSFLAAFCSLLDLVFQLIMEIRTVKIMINGVEIEGCKRTPGGIIHLG